MLNPIKIIIVLAVLAAGWMIWKRVSAASARRDRVGESGDRPRIEDTVRCPECQTFVPADSAGCDRANCPYRGEKTR